MQKITSWLWRKHPQNPPVEDAYWWDDNSRELVIVRGDSDPAESVERIPIEDAITSFSSKPYEKLALHSQYAFDFLKTKGN